MPPIAFGRNDQMRISEFEAIQLMQDMTERLQRIRIVHVIKDAARRETVPTRSAPQTCITASATSSVNQARFRPGPPYSSVRWFVPSRRN
jgi:hypothetical protein